MTFNCLLKELIRKLQSIFSRKCIENMNLNSKVFLEANKKMTQKVVVGLEPFEYYLVMLSLQKEETSNPSGCLGVSFLSFLLPEGFRLLDLSVSIYSLLILLLIWWNGRRYDDDEQQKKISFQPLEIFIISCKCEGKRFQLEICAKRGG